MEKQSVVYCLNTKLVDIKDSVTVNEGKKGMTRSIFWQYYVGLGMLFVLEQGEIEARVTVWDYGTRLGRRNGT